MLLDGYGLVYRGYFALPPLTTSKGELVNGAFGFASIVLRGIQDLQPDYVAVVLRPARPDRSATSSTPSTRRPGRGCRTTSATSSRRSARSSRRSGSRSTRCRATRPTTSSARSRTSSTRTSDLETTIVTVDLDMLQLVTPRVRLMTTRSGVENTVMYDVAKIDERFGSPRPDGRLQGAEGRPDRQHPGRPGSRREDRGEADPRLRRPRHALLARSTR